MRLEIEAQEMCLGQVTKTLIHPEITEGRGNCAICRYDLVNNINCAVYRDKANRVPVKFLDVVE